MQLQTQIHQCTIIRIKSAFNFIIEDLSSPNEQNNKMKVKQIKIQLIKQKQNQKSNKKYFYHLLPQLINHPNGLLTYKFIHQKSQNKLMLQNNQQYKKVYLYLNNINITSLYKEQPQHQIQNKSLIINQTISEYLPQQIIECFVIKVQCLKLILLNLQNLKFITFYFSQFKLVRPNNLHPKQSWEYAQKYFIQQIQGDFLQIKVNGTQKYREQTNIYGEILKVKNGDDIKEKLLTQGYVQLSKNANNYLSQQTIIKFNQMAQQAKNKYKGIWGIKNIKHFKKTTTQSQFQQTKYKKWQIWINNQNQLKSKNIQEEAKQIICELKKFTGSNIDILKVKIILNASQILFQKVNDKKIIKNLDQIIKILSQIFIQAQVNLATNIVNLDYLKFYSKCITLCIFYIDKYSDILIDSKQKFPSISEMQKILKVVFKTCYVGNQTFHQRLFGKKKQTNYDNFSFDSAYLNGGISSYSQQSDYDDTEKNKYESKGIKKLVSAQTKVRINSTYLISLIFKHYPSIVQNQWQICVQSNILTQDFFNYLKKQKIDSELINMSESEKKQLACLMRNNFGDPSLLLLTIFEKNIKVRTNALNCIFNMIINFQGKKMINTTQSFYIQKLLKETKSSFIPKSYIIFSGLKNILYFLLFTLKYEKNIEIIQTTFKTLCQLCNQCSLLDKLQFQDGMELLMENYINPVLSFPWNIPQLQQLKIVCISFLSVLVSTQKKWDQIQTNYLLNHNERNINEKLILILQERKNKKLSQDKICVQIIKYFTKLSKRYYESIFFQMKCEKSIWTYISQKCLVQLNSIFSNFISQIFKCNFDQIKIQEQNSKNEELSEIKRRTLKSIDSNNENLNKSKILLEFLQRFIPVYSQLMTNENYINLIQILTNIEYKQWKEQEVKLKNTKQFLFHIFDSMTNTKIQTKIGKNYEYPSIKTLQQNAFVRISLIKLLGYMSFCQQFQSVEILQHSVKLLLQYAKKYKTPNSIIKISWALSNWAKSQRFIKNIKKQQIQDFLSYLIQHSISDKQKIASNCTRGIGFFLNTLNKFYDKNNQKIDQEQEKIFKGLQEFRKKCRKSIIKNLDHVIIKVRTNSTKMLKSIASQLIQEKQIQFITPLLQQNILKNNYHLQTQTLLLIKDLGTPIQNNRLLKIYLTILKNLLNQSQLEYDFSQIKTVKQLRRIVLEQAIQLIQIWKQDQSKDIFLSVYSYLVDCYSEDKQLNKQNKMLQKGQQKGQQVQKLIFNIKNKMKYDEQNVVSTQTALKGFNFIAKKSDILLISKFKQIAEQRNKYQIGIQWAQLENIQIDNQCVVIGNIYI